LIALLCVALLNFALLRFALQAGEAATVVGRAIAAATEAETNALGVLSELLLACEAIEVASLLAQCEHVGESELGVRVVAAADSTQATTIGTSDSRSAHTTLASTVAEANLLAHGLSRVTLGKPVEDLLAEIGLADNPGANSGGERVGEDLASSAASLLQYAASNSSAAAAPSVAKLLDLRSELRVLTLDDTVEELLLKLASRGHVKGGGDRRVQLS